MNAVTAPRVICPLATRSPPTTAIPTYPSQFTHCMIGMIIPE